MSQVVLNQPRVLVLNRHWMPIFVRTPREAIEMMTSNGKSGKPAAMALDIDMKNGYCNPVTWDDWITLPVRDDQDKGIQSTKFPVRLPTVIIATNFDKLPPAKKVPLTLKSVLEREGYKCAYTGVPIDHTTANLDHVNPRSRGGKDTWENLVASKKEVNYAKADRTPEEAGLKLRIKPVAPKALPVSETIVNNYEVPEWELFLRRGKKGKSAKA